MDVIAVGVGIGIGIEVDIQVCLSLANSTQLGSTPCILFVWY